MANTGSQVRYPNVGRVILGTFVWSVPYDSPQNIIKHIVMSDDLTNQKKYISAKCFFAFVTYEYCLKQHSQIL